MLRRIKHAFASTSYFTFHVSYTRLINFRQGDPPLIFLLDVLCLVFCDDIQSLINLSPQKTSTYFKACVCFPSQTLRCTAYLYQKLKRSLADPESELL